MDMFSLITYERYACKNITMRTMFNAIVCGMHISKIKVIIN